MAVVGLEVAEKVAVKSAEVALEVEEMAVVVLVAADLDLVDSVEVDWAEADSAEVA